jgi:hypothetical protein
MDREKEQQWIIFLGFVRCHFNCRNYPASMGAERICKVEEVVNFELLVAGARN